jgi:hypothetical protein
LFVIFSSRIRQGSGRASSVLPHPPKTLREKLLPKNHVFFEKNTLREMPILKNLENKRKTTIGIMEKGKITSENTTVSQEFAKAMISERIKKRLG